MDNHHNLSWDQKNDLFVKINSLVLEGHSVRKACREYAYKNALGFDVVHGVYRRMKTMDGRSHGLQIFTNEMEMEIVACLQAFDNLHRGLSPLQVKAFVKQFRKEDSDWDPTEWYHDFLIRHQAELKVVKVKDIDHKRVQKNVYEATEEFVKWFPGYCGKTKKLHQKNL